jgi:hypothetical protein
MGRTGLPLLILLFTIPVFMLVLSLIFWLATGRCSIPTWRGKAMLFGIIAAIACTILTTYILFRSDQNSWSIFFKQSPLGNLAYWISIVSWFFVLMCALVGRSWARVTLVIWALTLVAGTYVFLMASVYAWY